MQKVYASNEAEILSYLEEKLPRHSCFFVRPSGRALGVWVVVGSIGECFTFQSVRRFFKKSIFTYDFTKSEMEIEPC